MAFGFVCRHATRAGAITFSPAYASRWMASRENFMATKKSPGKKSGNGRRYGKKAQQKVQEELHEMKEGKLRSGRSGKKVTNPKQAIAIGLSEARAEGDKVPPVPKKSGRSKKSSASKSSAQKSTGKKRTKSSSGKKSPGGGSKKKPS
jgi:hypothetical protein